MTKLVSLTEEAYELLEQHKKPGESFSKVVVRTLRHESPLMDLAGAWKNVKGIEKTFTQVFEERREFGKRRELHVRS